MALTDPKCFHPQELAWLQRCFQIANEDKSTYTDATEHALIADLLSRVRACILKQASSITLTASENEFFQVIIETWRETVGEVFFQGPPGSLKGEGDSGPNGSGIDTVYGIGLSGGLVGPNVFAGTVSIVNSILHRLRA
jgi:hypothetical protein